MTTSSPTPSLADYPLRFQTRDALAALPWFADHNGTVVLEDKTVGPIIDVHTHYALPSVVADHLDLNAKDDDSHLLLGRCCSHHLDIYANQNFTPLELKEMKRELVQGGVRGKGLRRYHTAPNLAADMQSMGVVHSVVIGIDMPVPTKHVARTLHVTSQRKDVTGFGSVYPRSLRPKHKFEEQLHAGSQGVKIHPPNMFIRPDNPKAMKIYGWCGEVGIPVFWHCGPAGIEPKLGAYCGQVRHYAAPIREFPNTTFVLGHSGATQHQEALALYKAHPNTYLDLSCISIGQMKDILDNCGDHSRLLFGSDWPFYHPILPLAKVLILTEGRPELRRAILHDNAARLLERVAARTKR